MKFTFAMIRNRAGERPDIQHQNSNRQPVASECEDAFGEEYSRLS